MNQREEKHNQLRLQNNRDELVERRVQILPADGILEVFSGLTLARSSKMTERLHSVFKPAFCVIAQGSKQVLLNEEIFRYDSGHYLISTVDLPIVSHIVEASQEKPYLSLRLNLDAAVVTSIMMESGIETKKGSENVKAMDVSSIDADMLDAVVRLVRLLDQPNESRILAPLIIKEIIYRLLNGEQGSRLIPFTIRNCAINGAQAACLHRLREQSNNA